MLRLLKYLTPILLIAAVFAMSLPAAAQTEPGQPAPSPVKPIEPAAVPCVPVGLALAVLSQDGTVADILPAPLRAGEKPIDTAGRTIVLPGPGPVGACADFQGFWGPGASGLEGARLLLYRLPAATDVTPEPIARDGFEEARTGPSMLQKPLRVITKLGEPGTYHFVAVLSVVANPRPATTNADGGVKDALRVPFTVIIKEPPALGGIEGFVKDEAGNPIAGAVVMVVPPAKARVAKQPGETLPIIGPKPNSVDPIAIIDDGAIGGPITNAGAGKVVTDEKGHYRIEVPAGKYIVGAQGRGLQMQFFKGKANLKEADPVEVKANETTSDINFTLKAVEPPKPPVYGVITGKVTKDDGTTPIKGAIVQAIQPKSTLPPGIKPLGDTDPIAPSRGLTAITNEDGIYQMKVPASKWWVTASAEGHKPQWFKGAEVPEKASVVEVAENTTVGDVNFALGVATPPPPPEKMGVAGTVTMLDSSGASQPVPGAIVLLAQRIEKDPSVPPQMVLVAKGQTGRDGSYFVPARPDKYIVGLLLARADAAGTMKILWFDNVTELKDATIVEVLPGTVTGDINFIQPPKP
jgi:hypothetical protein